MQRYLYEVVISAVKPPSGADIMRLQSSMSNMDVGLLLLMNFAIIVVNGQSTIYNGNDVTCDCESSVDITPELASIRTLLMNMRQETKSEIEEICKIVIQQENCNETQTIQKIKSEIEEIRQIVIQQQDWSRNQQKNTVWTAPEVEARCPPGFQNVSLAGSCYKVVYEPHNWTSANQRCHELHPEAHLVAITKEEENSALKVYLKEDLANNSDIKVCTHRLWGNSGNMLWTSGQRLNETNCTDPFVWKVSYNAQLPLSFTDWNPPEPNCEFNEEFCIQIRPSHNFRWNDMSCDMMLCPLCEYDLS